MRSSRVIATFLLVAAIFALVLGSPHSAPAMAGGSTGSGVPPRLEALSGPTDSAPLPTIGDVFAFSLVVEAPRRLASVKLHSRWRHIDGVATDAPAHTAQLRLRDARRDRLAMGDVLERGLCGTASFHTSTPPPTSI